LYLGKRSTL